MAQQNNNQSTQSAVSYLGWLIANKKDDVVSLLNKSGIAVLDTSNTALSKYVSEAIAQNTEFVKNVQTYQANHFSTSKNSIGLNSTKSIQQMFKNANGTNGFNTSSWSNANGNMVGAKKSNWKNTYGTINASQCVNWNNNGSCVDADFDLHYPNEIIGAPSTTGGSSSSSSSSNTTTSSGGGVWGFLGNVFNANTVSNLVNTGIGTLGNNINAQNQKDILELQLQIAKATTQAERDKLEAQKLALQQKSNSATASNKWLIPLVVGGGVLLIGTIVFLALRTSK